MNTTAKLKPAENSTDNVKEPETINAAPMLDALTRALHAANVSGDMKTARIIQLEGELRSKNAENDELLNDLVEVEIEAAELRGYMAREQEEYDRKTAPMVETTKRTIGRERIED